VNSYTCTHCANVASILPLPARRLFLLLFDGHFSLPRSLLHGRSGGLLPHEHGRRLPVGREPSLSDTEHGPPLHLSGQRSGVFPAASSRPADWTHGQDRGSGREISRKHPAHHAHKNIDMKRVYKWLCMYEGVGWMDPC
jgi:hypothetical protein